MRWAILCISLLATACEKSPVQVPPPPTPLESASLDGEVLEAIQSNLTAIEAKPQEAASRYNLGLLYLANGLPELAAQSFEQTVQLDPQSARGWSFLAESLADVGQLESAIKAISNAQRLAPTHRPLWWRPGFWLLSVGRAEEAMLMFDHALSLEPADRPAPDGSAYRIGLARCLLELDRPKEAISILEELQQLVNHEYVVYLLSQAYRRGNQIQDAEALGVIGAIEQPNFPDSWADDLDRSRRGLSGRSFRIEQLLEAGRLKEAHAVLDAAQARWPEDVSLINLLSKYYELQGNNSARIRTLRRAVRTDPTHHIPHLNLSKALQQNGDLQQALNSAHACVKANESFAPGWLQIGKLIIIINKLDRGSRPNDQPLIEKALVPLDRAFSIGVSHPQDNLMYGHMLFRAGRLDDAQRILDRLIELPDANPKAWAALSEVHTAKGDHRAALSTAIAGINRFPNQPDLARIIERYRRASAGEP